MGACATKPKVAKDDQGQAPQPAQEEMPAETEVKKAVAAAVGGDEEKKVADEKEIGEGDQPEGDKVKEVVAVVDADKVVDDDDGQSSQRRSPSNLFDEKNGEKQSMDGIKEATDQVKSENETIIEPLTQELSVTGGPTGSEKQVQSSVDTAPAEPVKLDKSGTEKFVLAPEMLPAEEKFESSKGPTPGKAAIDAPGKEEAEKLIEGTKSSQTDVEKKPEKTK